MNLPLSTFSRLLLLTVGFFLFGEVYSQTVKGKVEDASSGELMPFTNIFINNSTIGTTTDENGYYEISRTDLPGTFQLVASFVGYKTADKEVSIDLGETKTVNFILEPLESVLSEVELKSRRDKPWERNVRRFKNVFLALPDDPVASDLEIENPWVLEFEKVKPEKGANYIKATAQEPLIIINEALGYKILYYLQEYEFYKNKSSYFGLAFFEDLGATDSTSSSYHQLNKETSYQGSIKHLMKSILLQDLPDQGFKLYETFPEQMDRRRTNTFTVELGESIIEIPQDSIRRIPLRNGNFRVIWPGRVEVHFLKKNRRNEYYLDVYHPVGWVSAPNGFFDIDRNGVPIHPTQVVLSGYIGRPRMGRSLPHDFTPENTFENLAPEVITAQSGKSKWDNLREKPYITTNKPYYYPGETVWFGGPMLYQNSLIQDSLSRVLHVDLLNAKSELIQSEIYPIERGNIKGALIIPDTLDPGDYFLRAYTEWMRNYPERDIFLKALPVLTKGKMVKNQEIEEADYFGDLDFKLQDSMMIENGKTQALLNLSFLDATEDLLETNFSISVSDASLVSEINDRQTIMNAMEWLDEESIREESFYAKTPIEFGITLKGKFIKDKKRQADVNPITIVRGDLDDYGIVKTDSTGYFRATGLSFSESAVFAIAALDDKLRSYGSIELIETDKPVHKGSFPKFSLEEYTVDENKMVYDLSGDYILLEEFVREEEKIEALEDRNYGYGIPDREYSQEELENWPGSFLSQIIGMKFGNGGLGNFNFGLNAGEPLLIIDGSRYLYAENETATEVLNTFITDEVKSIDVYTLNAGTFGLAGFAGVIMIETKRGDRRPDQQQGVFNDEEFQKFTVQGFSRDIPFPNEPSEENPLQLRPTLYWHPIAITENGEYSFKVNVPIGVEDLSIRIEGVAENGLSFWKVFKLKVK